MSIDNRCVFSNLIWRYAERFLAQIITFIVSVVLARVLTPSDYGTVALMLVIINILEVFTSRGFNQALVQKKSIDNIDYSTIFWANMSIEAALYIAVFISAPFIANYYGNESITLMIRVFALRLIVSGFNSIQQAYVQRNMMFKKFFYSTLFGTLFSAVIGLYLAFQGAGPWALIIQSMTNQVVDTTVLFFTIKWKPELKFSKEKLRVMGGFGIRMMLMGLLDSIYVNVRSLVIGKHYSTEQLAFYNQGQKIPDIVINNTQTAASNVFFSSLSREKSISDIKNKTRSFMRIMFFCLCPLMVGIACVSREVILVLFTEKWAPSIPFMIVFCFAYLTWVPQMPLIQSFLALGKSKLSLINTIVNRVSGIVVLIVVLTKGPFAIAVGGLITDILMMLYILIESNKVIGYKLSEMIEDLAKTTIGAGFMVCTLFVTSFLINDILNPTLVLVLKIIVGIASYILIEAILKNHELKIIVERSNRIIKRNGNETVN